ncbi:MAG: hypothetical protein PVF73_11995 [Bacteroidales bacterium]|jgi:hypothetical protein
MTDKILKIVFGIILISTGLCAAQTNVKKKEPDPAMPENFNSLFLSFDYSTRTNTFGLINDQVKQPSYNAAIGFFSKYNFDVSVQTVFTGNADTSLTKTAVETDLMAGYAFSPTEDLTIYPSYTHMEYSRSANTFLSVFSDIAQLNIYYNRNVYLGGLGTSFLFGNKNMFYLSLQNALGFYFDNVVFRNSLLSIQLEFDLNLSDENYYNKFIYDSWNREEFITWGYKEYPGSLVAVLAGIRLNGLEETKETFYRLIEENDGSDFEASYTFTSANIVLPVYYSAGQFMFNFTTYLVIPTFSSGFYEQKHSCFSMQASPG